LLTFVQPRCNGRDQLKRFLDVMRTAGIWLIGCIGAIGGAATCAFAISEPSPPTVAVHVANYPRVPPEQLRLAQRTTSDVYSRAGVQLRWLDGSAQLAPDDGDFHLDMVLLSLSMIRRGYEAEGVLGRADNVSRRAYVLYPRVVDYTVANGSVTAQVLAYVMAHEIAHAILPSAHRPGGLMESTIRGRALIVPTFTQDQARALRATVAAPALLAHNETTGGAHVSTATK
jgi:hypothetical protein